MASSIFGDRDGNTVLQTMGQLKRAAGGNVMAACGLLDRAGVTRTLPNGQQVTASQFAQMMQGRTPQQAFQDMGMDFGRYQGMM